MALCHQSDSGAGLPIDTDQIHLSRRGYLGVFVEIDHQPVGVSAESSTAGWGGGAHERCRRQTAAAYEAFEGQWRTCTSWWCAINDMDAHDHRRGGVQPVSALVVPKRGEHGVL